MTCSENMSRIRSKDTGPEWAVRRVMWAGGLRYRVHVRSLPGCPDLVLPGRHIVIQVRGCFWHRHQGCAATRTPKTRTEWWDAKLARNVERDAEADAALSAAGWRVVVVWECETERMDFLATLAAKLKAMPIRGRRDHSGSD